MTFHLIFLPVYTNMLQFVCICACVKTISMTCLDCNTMNKVNPHTHLAQVCSVVLVLLFLQQLYILLHRLILPLECCIIIAIGNFNFYYCYSYCTDRPVILPSKRCCKYIVIRQNTLVVIGFFPCDLQLHTQQYQMVNRIILFVSAVCPYPADLEVKQRI